MRQWIIPACVELARIGLLLAGGAIMVLAVGSVR
jgi:hypothetical protein